MSSTTTRFQLIVIIGYICWQLSLVDAYYNGRPPNETFHEHNTRSHTPRSTPKGANSTNSSVLAALGRPTTNKKPSVPVGLNATSTRSRLSARSGIDSGAAAPLLSSQFESRDQDTRVPFWNIAHMINSIEHIEPELSKGANGIETDISFDKNGVPVEAYHGFPCDCGRHCHHREDLVKFIRYIASITVPPASSRLLIVLLDLKLKDLKEEQQKETAGRQLASLLHNNLYAEYQQSIRRSPNDITRLPPVRFIVSINHASDIGVVRAFIKYMRDNRLDFMSQNVGFDVGMNDNLSDISLMWDDIKGSTSNIWQGDGLTNCANIIRGVERLKEAISIRNGQGHFRKIYYWTADIMYHIRSVLRLGLDAILTNQPQRVLQVIGEPEFRDRYRLATPYDDPFSQFWIQPSAWKMSPPTLSEAVETVTNIQQTSANFVKTLPDGISAVIKKVHNSIIK